MRAELVALLALAGCGGATTVEVTFRAQPEVAAAIGAARSIAIHVEGAETYDVEYPLAGQLSADDLRWRYFADVDHGTLAFSGQCRDRDGVPIAWGTSGPVSLDGGGAARALVPLGQVPGDLDLGQPADLSPPPDGAPPDMSSAADLASPPDAALPTGLAAWYRFEEASGSVIDSSSHGNHGTLEGGGYTRAQPGKVGNAIYFTGAGGRVRVPASGSLDAISGFTAELWIYLTATGTTMSTVSRGTGSGDANILQQISNGNVQTIFSTTMATTNGTTSNGEVPLSTWTHVAVTNDGMNLLTYVNGALVHDDPGGDLGPLTSDLCIGSRENNLFALEGYLDEVKWWTVTRTQAQICADAGGLWNGASCAL